MSMKYLSLNGDRPRKFVSVLTIKMNVGLEIGSGFDHENTYTVDNFVPFGMSYYAPVQPRSKLNLSGPARACEVHNAREARIC